MSGNFERSGDKATSAMDDARRLLDELIQLLKARGPNRFDEEQLKTYLRQISQAVPKVSVVDENGKFPSMQPDAQGTYERLFGFNAAGRNYFRRDGGDAPPWNIQPRHVRTVCLAMVKLKICKTTPDFEDKDVSSWIKPLKDCLKATQDFFSAPDEPSTDAEEIGEAPPRASEPATAPGQSDDAPAETAPRPDVGTFYPVTAQSRTPRPFLPVAASSRYLIAAALLLSISALAIVAVILASRPPAAGPPAQVSPDVVDQQKRHQATIDALLASSIASIDRSHPPGFVTLAPPDQSSGDVTEALRAADPRLREALQLDQQGKHDAARDLRRVVAREHHDASDANRKIEAQTHRDLAVGAEAAGDSGEQIKELMDVVNLDPTAKDHNELGVAYLNNSDDDSAAEQFQAAIDADNSFAWPLNNLGNVFYNKGQYVMAIEYYTKAIAKDEKFANAYGNRANANQKLKRYELAIADYNEAIKIDDHFANAISGRGNTYFTIGKNDAALADYNRAIELDQDVALVFSNRGNLYRSQGKFDKARDDYDEATRLDRRFAPAYNGRGLILDRRGDYAGAVAQYDKAVQIDPSYVDALVNRGFSLLLMNRVDEAAESFSRAIKLPDGSDSFRTFFGRGIAYSAGASGPKRLNLAVADFLTSVRIDTVNAEGFAQLANVYAELGEYTPAAVNLQQALRLDPKSFSANGFSCLLQIRRQKFSEGLPYCDQLVQLEPENGFGFFLRGDLLLLKGDADKSTNDTEKGINDLERCTHLSTENGIGTLAEVMIAIARKQYDTAIEKAGKGLASVPAGSGRASILLARAGVYTLRQDWDNALRDYDEAIKERPTPLNYAYRASLYLRQEKYDEALKDYNALLELAPDYPRALQTRARILRRSDKAAALRDYDRLIQQRPSVSSLEERAALRSEAENRDGAMEDLAWALKLSNGETRAMVFALRAKVNERFGDHDAALKDYKDAIDVDPSDPDPWLWRARAYAAIPDVDRAVADYEVVIQKAPEFAEAYFEESGLYFDAGKFDNALDKLNQIKVQDQNQPYFYFRRGRVLYAMQDFAGAFPDFSKVSELGWGDNAANNLLLAKTYRYLGRYRDAVGNYLKAVRNSPDWPYAPISLYLARVQEGEKAPDVELASLAEKFDKAEWPYPIVELLLGQRSGDSVFALADNDEKRCEANFYVGERELLSAHNEKAVNYLSEAAKKCPRQFLEYADALFELKRLRP